MLDQLLIDDSASLKEALGRINANGLGVVFATDAGGRLTGLLTDGDIRRHLLANGTLLSAVTVAMKANCISLPVAAPRLEVIQTLVSNDKISIVPLLDDDGRVVDYASLRRHHMIQVAEPDLSGRELEYVAQCLRDNWISSQGPFVRRFEQQFASLIGGGEALATSSGTTALHLAFAALGIGPGDEVIVPDFTFAASVNAVLYSGATPVLVDIEPQSWNLDPEAVAAAITPRTKAILIVHLYGQPADLGRLLPLAERHGLRIVEDVAEALGGQFDGKPLGSFGDVAAFSFFANKLITTGEGGMLVAKAPEVAARARMLRDHGMNPKRRYWHEEIGYNYRMTNLQAAIGVAQLERIDSIIAGKQALAARYDSILRGVPGILTAVPPERGAAICWLYSFALDPACARIDRDGLMAAMTRCGIETRPLFYPLHEMPPYRGFAGNRRFAVTERISATGLSLPSSLSLHAAEIDYIARFIADAVSADGQRRANVGGL